MKLTSAILTVVVSLLSQASHAQLNNGGLYTNFGVDADTRSNYMKYGLVTGAIASDDWFSPLSANSIIDTGKAAYYLGLLKADINISFARRMPLMREIIRQRPPQRTARRLPAPVKMETTLRPGVVVYRPSLTRMT